MLTEKDLTKIGEEFGKFYEHNMAPQFEAIKTDVKVLTGRFDGLEKKFDGLEKRFDGLDNKFGGMERKLDKVDGRLSTLVTVLEKKHVINEDDKLLIHA